MSRSVCNDHRMWICFALNIPPGINKIYVFVSKKHVHVLYERSGKVLTSSLLVMLIQHLFKLIRSLIRVTIRAIFPGCVLARISILLWFKVPRDAFRKHKEPRHTPIGLHTQTKPNPRYFRQYRNPGQDASWENGTYGHPTLMMFSKCLHQNVIYTLLMELFFLSETFKLDICLMFFKLYC